MDQEYIDNIKEYSEEVLTQYDDLKRMENADEEYAKTIAQKKKEDDANRKNFLKYNAEMTGLSLEFRNIYGVEPMGVYKESDYRIRKMDQFGNLVSDLNGTPLYEIYRDSKDLVYAANMNKDSLFFVDNMNDSETSGFHIPYNPPQYTAWTGDKVYRGLSRYFYKTEKAMYTMISELNNSAGSDFSFVPYTGSYYFDSNNPAWFWSDQDGNIQFEEYKVIPDVSNLVQPGGDSNNPSYPYSISAPTISLSSKMYNLGDLPLGDVVAFTLSFNPTNIGYAYVAQKEGGKVLLDILSYSGSLKSRPRTRARWKWFLRRTEYIDPNRFYISFSNTVKRDDALINKLLLEYEKYYIDEVLYYIEQIEEPTTSTKNSIAGLKVMKTAFNNYRRDNNINILLSKMKERVNSLYGSLPPQRAVDINNEMKTSTTFEKVYETILPRLDKRTGTLRELIKYENNINEAKKMMVLKERAIDMNKGKINVYRFINDSNGSNYIEISLERDTEDAFFNHIKWLSEVYVVCDDKNTPPLLVSVESIEKKTDTKFKPKEDDALDPKLTYPFKREILLISGVMILKMSKPIPTIFSIKNNARVVRLL